MIDFFNPDERRPSVPSFPRLLHGHAISAPVGDCEAWIAALKSIRDHHCWKPAEAEGLVQAIAACFDGEPSDPLSRAVGILTAAYVVHATTLPCEAFPLGCEPGHNWVETALDALNQARLAAADGPDVARLAYYWLLRAANEHPVIRKRITGPEQRHAALIDNPGSGNLPLPAEPVDRYLLRLLRAPREPSFVNWSIRRSAWSHFRRFFSGDARRFGLRGGVRLVIATAVLLLILVGGITLWNGQQTIERFHRTYYEQILSSLGIDAATDAGDTAVPGLADR